MKRVYIVATFFLILACKNETINKNAIDIKKDSVASKQIKNDTNNKIVESEFEGELEQNEELVSSEDFKTWKGKYSTNYEYADLEYNEFVVYTKLNLIKRDSCVLENWFEKKEDKTKKRNNYFKILGNLYFASNDNSRVEFMESKILVGESPNLSPVFSLKKINNEFLINSLLSSPPNNGIIDMPISKD